jgi:serine/threonine protein kinase
VVLERIGSGAFATVYRCERQSSNGRTEFAAKVMDLERLRFQPRFEDCVRSIKREISILWTLRHERIAQLHDVVDMTSKTILVLEFMAGGHLQDFIVARRRSSGGIAPDIARHIFIHVVEGLQFVHSKCIVHRDLKPENILLSSSSEAVLPDAKLSDFGLSKQIMDGYTHAETACGTPQYWAPEVVKHTVHGGGKYDFRADLWSLGMVLYVMLMGHVPFQHGEYVRFRGTWHADELHCGLTRKRPQDRMSLEECLQSAWIIDSGRQQAALGALSRKAVSEPQLCAHGAQPSRLEIRLPHAPADVAALKGELLDFASRHRVPTSLHFLHISVTLSDAMAEDAVKEAQEELVELARRHVPELKAQADQGGQPLCEEVLQLRREELESLEAAYGSELEVLGKDEWLVRLGPRVALRVRLPPGYPLSQPPKPDFECPPHARVPAELAEEMVSQWLPGDFAVCLWAERLRLAVGPSSLEGGAGQQRGSRHRRFVSFMGSWALKQLDDIEPGETREFPTSLTSFQRFVLHRLAAHVGWEHESRDVPIARAHLRFHPRGADPKEEIMCRQILVTRPSKGAPELKNLDIPSAAFLADVHERRESRGERKEKDPALQEASSPVQRPPVGAHVIVIGFGEAIVQEHVHSGRHSGRTRVLYPDGSTYHCRPRDLELLGADSAPRRRSQS